MEYSRNINKPIILFKVSEIAKICKVTTWTVKNWIKEGKLEAIRLGSTRVLRVSAEMLSNFLGERDNSIEPFTKPKDQGGGN